MQSVATKSCVGPLGVKIAAWSQRPCFKNEELGDVLKISNSSFLLIQQLIDHFQLSNFKFQTSQNGQRLKTSRKNYLKCEWMKRGPFSFFKPHRQACIRQHQSVVLSRGIMAGAGRCQALHQQQLLLLYHNLFCFQAKRPPDSYLGFCWCWKKLQIGTTRAKQTRDKETPF